MKQFQLEEVKFPKLATNAIQQPILKSKRKKNSTAHSEMLRIIVALLIAIFIFNSGQETTINYNEIIKNQKMFLVKNIRGVLPTLSGQVIQLQQSWKVVHFENFHSNQSEIFNNFTLTFIQSKLVIQNHYCLFNFSYEWKNYSYNIDFKEILGNKKQPVKTKQYLIPHSQKSNLTQGQNQSTKASDKNERQTDINAKNDSTQTEIKQDPAEIVDNKNQIENATSSYKEVSEIMNQKKLKCQNSKQYFKQIFQFASVWTISDSNLYILLQNTHLEEDFYLILQPKEI